MTATATAFINAALQEVGYREGKNNDNKYGIWYGWNYQPYCAIALSWVAAQVGAEAQIGGKWAYCPYWAAWFRQRGKWSNSNPQRGDIVFYDWTGAKRQGKEQHVGILVSVVDSTHIKVAEFNTVPGTGNQSDGGGVYIRTRHISTVVGYGKVDWAPETKPVPIPGAKSILVVDGAWGIKTTRRLQQVLNVKVDGELGSQTYAALSRWVGLKPEAVVFSLALKRALQKKLKVTVDGVIGPTTVKALQSLLNRS